MHGIICCLVGPPVFGVLGVRGRTWTLKESWTKFVSLLVVLDTGVSETLRDKFSFSVGSGVSVADVSTIQSLAGRDTSVTWDMSVDCDISRASDDQGILSTVVLSGFTHGH